MKIEPVLWWLSSGGVVHRETEDEYYRRVAKPDWTMRVIRLLDRYHRWRYRRAYRRARITLDIERQA